MSADDVLRIQLLGGFRVSAGGRTTDRHAWRLRAAAGIVKLLALAPSHRLHREQIIDALWPDSDPEAASGSLRFALHTARRLLAGESAGAPVWLVREGELLALAPASQVWVDVHAFEAAIDEAWPTEDAGPYLVAAALYTGELLPEDPYDDWVADRRTALHNSYVTLLTRLADLHERDGDLPRAIAVSERLVASEPLNEEAQHALLRRYALAGQRRQALAQYAQLRDILDRELGVEPDAATQTLYQAIVERRVEVLPRPDQVARVAAARPPRDAALPAVTAPARHDLPTLPTPLVGREREVERISALLRRDDGRLVTLTGPGGIGKTRLALHVASLMLDDFPDGVTFVHLAAINDPALVLPTIAVTLRLPEQPAATSSRRSAKQCVTGAAARAGQCRAGTRGGSADRRVGRRVPSAAGAGDMPRATASARRARAAD